jgi:hypothetical protein
MTGALGRSVDDLSNIRDMGDGKRITVQWALQHQRPERRDSASSLMQGASASPLCRGVSQEQASFVPITE